MIEGDCKYVGKSPVIEMLTRLRTEVGIYKRKKKVRKKERKHALDHESDQENDQYKKKVFFLGRFLVFFYKFPPQSLP